MTDRDVLLANHEFIRDEEADDARISSSWGVRLARNYYDKLYKEFAIIDLSDLSRIGMRWRIESEVLCGKGQQMCGEKSCVSCERLAIYEVPFAYIEHEIDKLELVKVTLCKSCAKKLIKHSEKNNCLEEERQKSSRKKHKS